MFSVNTPLCMALEDNFATFHNTFLHYFHRHSIITARTWTCCSTLRSTSHHFQLSASLGTLEIKWQNLLDFALSNLAHIKVHLMASGEEAHTKEVEEVDICERLFKTCVKLSFSIKYLLLLLIHTLNSPSKIFPTD